MSCATISKEITWIVVKILDSELNPDSIRLQSRNQHLTSSQVIVLYFEVK